MPAEPRHIREQHRLQRAIVRRRSRQVRAVRSYHFTAADEARAALSDRAGFGRRRVSRLRRNAANAFVTCRRARKCCTAMSVGRIAHF